MTAREDLRSLAGEYRRKADAARRDNALTPYGKYLELKRLYDDYSPRADLLRSLMERGEQVDTSALRRRLFGLPQGADSSDAISFRDAQDRVAGLKADALTSLMDRAEQSGDELLLRAGFARAWELSLIGLESMADEIVAEYALTHPNVEQDLNRLRDTRSTIQQALVDRVEMAIPRPQELSNPPLEHPASLGRMA